MTKKIIYKTTDGSLAIITPAPDSGLSLIAIALMDVPAGLPFKIIDEADMQSDRTFRNAWDVDLSDPHGVGGDFGAGSNIVPIDWVGGNHPIVADITMKADGTYDVLGVHSWGDLGALPDKSSVKITVDMSKAREIKRNMIRAERGPVMQSLDVDYMRALEGNDTAALAGVAAKKQALRDATVAPEIDAALTPEQLKEFVPEVFK